MKLVTAFNPLFTPFTFVLFATLAGAGKPINSSRLPHNIRNFYKLHTEQVEYCFAETESALEFYLTNCENISKQKPHQSFELSGRAQTRLSQDVALLKKQLLESGAATPEKIASLEALAKRDTIGRFIFMTHGGDKIPVGWISHDLELDGREHNAQVQDFCSGTWSAVCSYEHSEREFSVAFNESKYDDESGETIHTKYPIQRVLYAGVFSRGNDDFIAYHYYNLKGTGDKANAEFPISQEWKDALTPYLADKTRFDEKPKQVKTPRGEPNYLTGIHPVYIVEIKAKNQELETKLIFGAAVIYMKNSPATESCEDDTGSYELVDFDLFKDKLTMPYSGYAIEKLDLSEHAGQSKTIQSIYSQHLSKEQEGIDSSELPQESESTHYDLFNIGTSVNIDPSKNFQTQIVMKIDQTSEVNNPTLTPRFTEIQRSNAVREFIEITKNDTGLWKVNVTAFNPNDYKKSNSVRSDGRFLINEETISEIWTAEKGFTGISQPFQRAVAKELKTLEKKSREGVESREWLASIASQHSKYIFNDFQSWTAHAKSGLIGNYINAFRTYISYGGKESVEKNPMRSIVPRVTLDNMYIDLNDFEKSKLTIIDPMVVEIYTGDRTNKFDQTIAESLTRIANAEDPVAKIRSEFERAELIYNQVGHVLSFFSWFVDLNEDADKLNEQLAIVQARPIAKRPLKYFETKYNDNGEDIGGEWIAFPERMKKLILSKNKARVSNEDFFKEVEVMLLNLKDLESKKASTEQILAAGKDMYKKILTEKDFLFLHHKLRFELNRP